MRRMIKLLLLGVLVLQGCNNGDYSHDASGVFEATEVIVAAQVSGEIEVLDLVEGDHLLKNQKLGYVDTVQLHLKRLALQTVSEAVSARKSDVKVQIAATKNKILNAEKEQYRVQRMFADGAATQKQLDEVETTLAVLKNQLLAQISSLTTSNSSIDKERAAHEVEVAQVEDLLQKSSIINPIEGVVLAKYAEAHEYALPGKPLYKVANLKKVFLRAYINANQIAELKIGQEVKVYIVGLDGREKSYKGHLSTIADKAEFTPKTIQTKDERQNLVYAIKIAVDNSAGDIKIGMYGDVDF